MLPARWIRRSSLLIPGTLAPLDEPCPAAADSNDISRLACYGKMLPESLNCRGEIIFGGTIDKPARRRDCHLEDRVSEGV